MAIAMARAGGIGVLHKNMSIDRQAMQVDIVKRSESGMIINPYTLPETASLREAANLMARFRVSGVPIVDGEGRLVGIITNRDLQFEKLLDQPVAEAMTKTGLVTAPLGTTLDEAERILAKHRVEKLPVIDADRRLKGLITVKDIHKRRQYPGANKDQHGRLRVAAAIGAAGDYLTRARALIDAGVDAIIIDTAHGHAVGVLDATARVREAFPDTQLVVGNVATREGAEALVERGVDAVKVGVGPGSICTTRVVTGVGVPQLTAVFDAVEGAGDIPVIADGCLRCRTAAPIATSRKVSSRRRSWFLRASRGACRTRARWPTSSSRWWAVCAAAWATWGAAPWMSFGRRRGSCASRRRGCASRTRTT